MPTTQEFAFQTIRELGRRLRAGETTAAELADYFVDRLESVGRRFNAVVTVTRERARREAALADAELKAGHDRGPLHGIPYGAKDLLATANIPTTWGAAPYRDQVFDFDATVVSRLREAGAVLAGKLAMVELAGGMGYEQPNASLTGPGLNPWNPEAWSGGSSSGSGSAVGAGAVPFAIGSETQGSITTPSSYCGVTGLRPTYGRVSRHGAMALSWTMDKLGPMARTADDCGLVLGAIAGPDPADPTAVARSFAYRPEGERASGFRFAVPAGATEGTQPEVAAGFEATLAVLRRLGTVEEVNLPEFPYTEVARVIIASEAGAAFAPLIGSGRIAELTAPEDRVRPYSYAAITAAEYLQALRIRRAICRALDDLCARYDALVAPTNPSVAPPIDRPFGRDVRRPGPQVGAAGNIAGLPAITIPNGFGERGLPTAVQFVGRAFEENRLLAIARLVQSQTDWHSRRPPLGE